MGRRVLFLAALGLAACKADMPTEPTLELSPFQAVLPPIPAPPTALTAQIPGGDGNPVSVGLGFYESPVYSKVTISGLLTYSGMETGYLVGTGQIDAAGLYIGNQNLCTLQLGVRVQNTTGAFRIQPLGGCPSAPRQIGSYTVYQIISGLLTAERFSGPPLSCRYGGSPCVSYTGSQNVTITPEEGQLVLTPNKTVAAPGGGITVNAKGVWAGTTGVTVPMTPREWRWEGSGPELGGGHTKVCAVYNINQCVVQVYQSGHVALEAIVNGKVKTEKVWIRVVGGDSLPPVVDTLPTDSLPSDSLPDDECPSNPSAGLALAACEPPIPPTATVECEGAYGVSEVIRGANVTCTVTVTPTQSFTVNGWQVTPDGSGTQSQVGSSTLAGPAVVGTDVGATVTLADGTNLTATSTRFTVTARGWAKLQLPAQSPTLFRHRMDPYRSMTALPIQGRNYALGGFALPHLDFETLPVTVAGDGPNKGYAFFNAPPRFPVPEVYTHPQLAAGGWYNDQNGGLDRSTKARRCDATALPVLEQKIEVHEGMTRITESHWGVAYDIFELSRMTPNWEALVDPNGKATAIQLTAQGQFNAIWQRYLGAQGMFDDLDYPRIFGSLGCALDMDQSPADG